MGRIDQALRQADKQKEPQVSSEASTVSPPTASAFASPWVFEGDAENVPRSGPAVPPAGSPRPESPDAPSALVGRASPLGPASTADGEMAVFAGFKAEILDRIVASPTAGADLTEQFRTLAATLHHAQVSTGMRTLMITSAMPNDGKTLSASNVALTLSQSYRRQVLLIDADLRRPSLHDVFQVPNIAGLNDSLRASGDHRLPVIKISETLTLLPAGLPDPDPMSSLTSDRMRRIVEEASARFDWVVLDTPPVALLSDARLLAGVADGALMVVRAGVTPYAMVRLALDSLGRDRVLGIILNGCEGRRRPDDYSRYGYESSTDAR